MIELINEKKLYFACGVPYIYRELRVIHFVFITIILEVYDW